MRWRVEQGKADQVPCDLLLLFAFESEEAGEGVWKEVDQVWKGFLADLVRRGEFKGELHECQLLYTQGVLPFRKVLLTGLGKREGFDLDRWRGAAARAGQAIRDGGTKRFLFPVAETGGLAAETLSEAFVTGFLLGTYRYTEFKTLEKEKLPEVDEGILLAGDAGAARGVEAGVAVGRIVSEAVYLARDLVNGPANSVTPTLLAGKAEEIGRAFGMGVEVMEVSQAEALGMGAYAAVAKGSQEPGKFIVLEHNKGKGLDTIALVGKGITFDSGGISIKPSEKMERMKDDMSGAAAVLGAMKAAAELGLPLHLVGILPATENLPDGKAYKPGDILKTLSGQTVEVISTDAEGRLVLCDALTYSLRFEPKAIVDLASLTGACVIALGDYVSALLGNSEGLMRRIEEASRTTNEKVWRLPLWDEYFDYLKSDAADFRNVGTRSAGAIIGGIFLSRFVGKSPWAHLDIAGPASIEKDLPYSPRGGTGAGVRLLIQLLRDWKPEAL